MALALVVTRTKNRPLLLERAIVSVISQDYPNWKHIIVNDGGESQPVENLIEKYADAYKGRVQTIHILRRHGGSIQYRHTICRLRIHPDT